MTHVKNERHRCVHTMKVMCIESELFCIVCVHTECALTITRIECAFSQSTSIDGLKLVWKWMASWRDIRNSGVIFSRVIGCVKKQAIR